MSQWSGSGALPPPPGVEANFDNPDDHLEANITLHAIFLTVVTCCVFMRIYTRHFIVQQLGWDDFLVCISYGLTICFSGLLLKSYTWGIGRHIWDEPATWLSHAFRWFMIGAWLYTPLITSCKLAILAIYWRIFRRQRSARIAMIVGAVLIVCANLAVLFAAIFVCTPVQRSWDLTLDGSCGDSKPSAYISGVFNVVEDLYVLLLPLPYLSEMNMRTARKLRVMAVFGLGTFALVASIVRMIKTKIIVTGLDSTRNMSNMAIWAVIEVNVSIICTCLMVLPAFLDRHWPRALSNLFSQSFTFVGTSDSQKGTKNGFIKSSSGTDVHPAWVGNNPAHASDTKLTELSEFNTREVGWSR